MSISSCYRVNKMQLVIDSIVLKTLIYNISVYTPLITLYRCSNSIYFDYFDWRVTNAYITRHFIDRTCRLFASYSQFDLQTKMNCMNEWMKNELHLALNQTWWFDSSRVPVTHISLALSCTFGLTIRIHVQYEQHSKVCLFIII